METCLSEHLNNTVDSHRLRYADKEVHIIKNFNGKTFVIVKAAPGTRRCTTVGRKLQKNVNVHAFVSTNKLLLKIRKTQFG